MSRIAIVVVSFGLLIRTEVSESAELRVGASVVDVTPRTMPVLVNGGMLSRSADKIKTAVNARALVLDDGRERIAMVVVDSCMMPRPLLDEAKQLAAQRTKIRPDRMLISATHTHSAPASMGCLGTDADAVYVPYLREKLAEAIAAAESNLEPARVGWATQNAAEYTALRRWVRRPDRIAEDPFGNRTVRANMHAGRVWDDVTGESGPEDPDLSMIAFQAKDGRPIAVLANFSMHYFGDDALSADYFGLFCGGLKETVAARAATGKPPFVAALSHGCSGDIWRRDYTKPLPAPADDLTLASYTDGLLRIARQAYDSLEYRTVTDLAMAETRMTLNYRVPDKQRLEWAQRTVEAMGKRLAKDQTEVYAREQILLHERQSTELVVQAVRIGDIAIATTPTETYALTGLKLKLQSPLSRTMVIELANGGDGYIPPPEQHVLGGYNTWAARSAGLEVQAEPKITEAALGLLEAVAAQPRRVFRQSRGSAALSLAHAKPLAWWRLDEFAGPRAADSTGQGHDAYFEPGVVFFLDGPRSDAFCTSGETNRAAHFAGGRIDARLALGQRYSVSLWFWNGMPLDGRDIAGWFISRGFNHGSTPASEHLGLGGKLHSGRLLFQRGGSTEPLLVGRSSIQRWTWNHVLLVRDGESIRVYLNGAAEPDIDGRAPVAPTTDQWFVGGRSDNLSNWEGRLDEVAVFDRALTPDEAQRFAAREPEEVGRRKLKGGS